MRISEWSENVSLFESQSNRNDFTHFVDLLVQSSKFSKSVTSKVVKDGFKQFVQKEIQNIERIV